MERKSEGQKKAGKRQSSEAEEAGRAQPAEPNELGWDLSFAPHQPWYWGKFLALMGASFAVYLMGGITQPPLHRIAVRTERLCMYFGLGIWKPI